MVKALARIVDDIPSEATEEELDGVAEQIAASREEMARGETVPFEVGLDDMRRILRGSA